MKTEVKELYAQVVKSLPPAERLQLATLILNDIPPQTVMDLSSHLEEMDEETERTGWRLLSAAVNRHVWDNPIDAADWDNWRPQQKLNRQPKVGRAK